jgi:hypothetical protein
MEGLPPRPGVAVMSIKAGTISFQGFCGRTYRNPRSGVGSLTIGYEGNRQLAALVGSSPRSNPATLFSGSHYVPSLVLAHACIIAATFFSGSQ